MLPRLLPRALPILVSFAFLAHLPAAPTAVSIRVEQDNAGTETSKTDKFTKTYRHALVIYVSNTSSVPLDLKVKHIIFGRDTVSHEIVAIDQSEDPLSVKSLATEKIETKSGVSTAVQAHYDIRTKAKIAASGATIIGYGVQVMQGDTLAGESYEPASLKDQWAKTASLTPATAAGVPPPAKAPATPPAAAK